MEEKGKHVSTLYRDEAGSGNSKHFFLVFSVHDAQDHKFEKTGLLSIFAHVSNFVNLKNCMETTLERLFNLDIHPMFLE